MVKAKVESGDVAGGAAQLGQLVDQEKAAGRTAPESWYRYAIGKLYKTKDSATTLQWVQRWLTAYPSSKNWRDAIRSEEHTSELQSLMRISYAVFCLKKKKTTQTAHNRHVPPATTKKEHIHKS